MAYINPHVYDSQSGSSLTPGWTATFLTPGSSVTRIQNSPYWPASTWVRRHVIASNVDPRDRSYASYNSMGVGMDNGDDSGPGATIWEYGEFAVPSGFPWSGGSWNNLWDWHHSTGANGSVGQVPMHINTTDVRGTRELTCQVRGGFQVSDNASYPTAPNNEDFLLDSPFKYDHVYRIMVRRTLAPNGTPPQRNQFISGNNAGAHIVPLSIGDSHGIVEVWVDDVLKVSKRRPTSYYNLSMYRRTGLDRNGSSSPPSATLYWTKCAQHTTRAGLFSIVVPATVDTFADGGDSSSGGGGGGTFEPDVLPGLPGGKVRWGTYNVDGTPPGSRVDLGADRVRATGPITIDQTTTIEKAYFHIESTATGSQVFKLVVWDDDGVSGEASTRKILSSEVTVSCPTDPIWQQITVSPNVELTAGNYWVGVHSGATASLIDYAYENVANSGRTATDTYADGTPTTFPGGASLTNFKAAIVLEGIVTGGGGGGSEDTTEPTVISAETQVPVFIVMQLDEELDTALNPDIDAFTATVGGIPRQPIATVANIDTVTLEFAQEIPEGVTVTLSYFKTDATNKIVDLAGNELASFTNIDVENSVLPPGYERDIALPRTVDPPMRAVDPSRRIIGRTRPIWT